MNDEYYTLGTDSRVESYAFSPENPNGARNGGTRGKAWEKLSPCFNIKSGETLTIVDIDGPGVLQSMWFGGYTGWEFIIRIYWDNQENPAVECPLCSFFGFGFNVFRDVTGNFPTLNSAMVLVAPCRGMNCYWKMPFLRHCRVTLENRSNRTESTYYTVNVIRKSLPENIRYFCASYRQSFPVEKDTEYTIIDGIEGQGHFAGVSLSAGLNGNNGCWVEGEAKMFIDGDTYPSINYTGTEDYFSGSYAWGCDNGNFRYEPFSGLYSGMFAQLGDNTLRYNYQPRFMMYRWHIPDPIYFNSSFRMTLQDLPKYRDDFSSVAYWYQALPIAPFAQLPSNSDVDRT